MATVTVKVNGHSYKIACDDGEEEHVAGLAEYVDKRVADLVGGTGQVGEARLILMASLVIADELSDAVDRIEALEGQLAGGKDAAAPDLDLGGLAGRLEDIAARLESR